MRIKTIAILCCLALMWAVPSLARVQGPCTDCHTMHNSQDGSVVYSGGPFRALTRGECVACHTGTNDGTNNIPYVMSTGAPTYGPDYNSGTGAYENTGNTLAGGNFYWVATAGGADDATGHNVSNESLCGADGAIGNTPPGFVSGWGTTGIGATWVSNQLTCAGTYGCHGSHTYADDFADISGAHHATDTTIDGTTVGTSYRFCYNILGKEYNTAGNAWEYQPTTTAHNQYKGYDRTSTTSVPTIGDTTGGDTINFLCGECHGDYHSGANVASTSPIGQNPWLRHPSDYDMGNTLSGSEYRSYYGADGTTVGAYNVVAPVASADVSAVLSQVGGGTGAFDDDAIVNCISCHRAHGSPYDDLLRWDYANMQASAGGSFSNKGCFACHTTKD